MPIEFDWTILKDIGVGGLGAFALYLFYKSFIFFIERWKESTDAINRNTDTHQSLTQVFTVFYDENKEFQKETLTILKDTHKKVNSIDRKVTVIKESLEEDN